MYLEKISLCGRLPTVIIPNSEIFNTNTEFWQYICLFKYTFYLAKTPSRPSRWARCNWDFKSDFKLKDSLFKSKSGKTAMGLFNLNYITLNLEVIQPSNLHSIIQKMTYIYRLAAQTISKKGLRGRTRISLK